MILLFEGKCWWKDAWFVLLFIGSVGIISGFMEIIGYGLGYSKSFIAVVLVLIYFHVDFIVLGIIIVLFLIIWIIHKRSISVKKTNDQKCMLFESRKWWKEYLVIIVSKFIIGSIILQYTNNIVNYFSSLDIPWISNFVFFLIPSISVFLIIGILHIIAEKKAKPC